MMLKVQEYLRSGKSLDDLKADFAISSRVNERLNVVSLNYSMIESPMSERIVQECRCLILEMGTWDVKGITYDKFFNHGESHVPTDFDWNDFRTYEKLDGSLIALWYHDTEGWQVSTRSIPDGSNEVDDSGLSYRELVLKTLHDMGVSWGRLIFSLHHNFTFIFELMTPENQIVVHHTDRKLVLTGIRSIIDPYSEVFPDGWNGPVPTVRLHEGFSREMVMSLAQDRNPLEHEGFVLVDSRFNRVKVKSDAYCLMSHQRDGLGKSNKARLELILTEKDDDVLPLLPVFIQDKILFIKTRLLQMVSEVDTRYEEIRHIETQKDFAQEALKSKQSSVLFAIRLGKVGSAMEWFVKSSPKTTLDWLNLKEEETQ